MTKNRVPVFVGVCKDPLFYALIAIILLMFALSVRAQADALSLPKAELHDVIGKCNLWQLVEDVKSAQL